MNANDQKTQKCNARRRRSKPNQFESGGRQAPICDGVNTQTGPSRARTSRRGIMPHDIRILSGRVNPLEHAERQPAAGKSK